MNESILQTVRKVGGNLADDNKVFDSDLIVFINSELMTLNQLGVGPKTGFVITGETETWEDFIGSRKDMESVKAVVCLKAHLAFDPPSSSFVIQMMKDLISEAEFRLSVEVEETVE